MLISIFAFFLTILTVQVIYTLMGFNNRMTLCGLSFIAVGVVYYCLTKLGVPIITLRYGVIPQLKSGDAAQFLSLGAIVIGGVLVAASLFYSSFFKNQSKRNESKEAE